MYFKNKYKKKKSHLWVGFNGCLSLSAGPARDCRMQADSLGDLYRALEQTGLASSADHRSASRLEYKRSFVHRVNDPLLSDKLHRLRILHSSLKVQQHVMSIYTSPLRVLLFLFTNWHLGFFTECPSSRHTPITGLFRLRMWFKPQTHFLCLCLTQPTPSCWR